MGATLYLCGPTMHVAKIMWSFLDSFFFFFSAVFVSHGCLKKKKKKIQLKWVQEVWAPPVLRYSVREFAEIEPVQREDLSKSSGEAREQIRCLKCRTPDRASLSGQI